MQPILPNASLIKRAGLDSLTINRGSFFYLKVTAKEGSRYQVSIKGQILSIESVIELKVGVVYKARLKGNQLQILPESSVSSSIIGSIGTDPLFLGLKSFGLLDKLAITAELEQMDPARRGVEFLLLSKDLKRKRKLPLPGGIKMALESLRPEELLSGLLEQVRQLPQDSLYRLINSKKRRASCKDHWLLIPFQYTYQEVTLAGEIRLLLDLVGQKLNYGVFSIPQTNLDFLYYPHRKKLTIYSFNPLPPDKKGFYNILQDKLKDYDIQFKIRNKENWNGFYPLEGLQNNPIDYKV